MPTWGGRGRQAKARACVQGCNNATSLLQVEYNSRVSPLEIQQLLEHLTENNFSKGATVILNLTPLL